MRVPSTNREQLRCPPKDSAICCRVTAGPDSSLVAGEEETLSRQLLRRKAKRQAYGDSESTPRPCLRSAPGVWMSHPRSWLSAANEFLPSVLSIRRAHNLRGQVPHRQPQNRYSLRAGRKARDFAGLPHRSADPVVRPAWRFQGRGRFRVHGLQLGAVQGAAREDLALFRGSESEATEVSLVVFVKELLKRSHTGSSKRQMARRMPDVGNERRAAG